MKRLLIPALMVMGFSSMGICADAPKSGIKINSATAEVAEDNGGKLDKRVQDLTAKLSLTKTQQDSVRKIFTDARAKNNSLRDEMKAKHKAIRTEVDAKITALLKPDQKAKFLELRDTESEKNRMSKDAAGN